MISRNWNLIKEFAGVIFDIFGQEFLVTFMNYVSLSAIFTISPSTIPECFVMKSVNKFKGT